MDKETRFLLPIIGGVQFKQRPSLKTVENDSLPSSSSSSLVSSSPTSSSCPPLSQDGETMKSGGDALPLTGETIESGGNSSTSSSQIEEKKVGSSATTSPSSSSSSSSLSSSSNVSSSTSNGSTTPTKDELPDCDGEDKVEDNDDNDDVFIVAEGRSEPDSGSPNVEPSRWLSTDFLTRSQVSDLEATFEMRLKELQQERKRSLPEHLRSSCELTAVYKRELKERLLWCELRNVFVDWFQYHSLVKRVAQLEEDVKRRKMHDTDKSTTQNSRISL